MALISFIFEGRKKNKLVGKIIIDNGNYGTNTSFEYTPKELLDKLDELNTKENEILSNEPIFLEISMLKENKEQYSKYRQFKCESILDWWLE